MRRNSSPTALGDRSRESWTEAVAPKTLAFHDANSDGGVRSPWTCMARSAKGGEHGPTAAHSPLDFVVQSVRFSWRSILACHTRSFNTKRVLSKMSNQTSMEVSPAERDALVLLLEKEHIHHQILLWLHLNKMHQQILQLLHYQNRLHFLMLRWSHNQLYLKQWVQHNHQITILL